MRESGSPTPTERSGVLPNTAQAVDMRSPDPAIDGKGKDTVAPAGFQ